MSRVPAGEVRSAVVDEVQRHQPQRTRRFTKKDVRPMFIDEATIRVKAGDDGNGCLAFRREKYVPLWLAKFKGINHRGHEGSLRKT
jgi:hypothetical protein